jgi:hypothetical protein
MIGYRLRIALLSLGVLFGFGSAFGHFGSHHGDYHHCDCGHDHHRD